MNEEFDGDFTKINSSFKPKLWNDVKVIFYKEDERGKFYLLINPRTEKNLKLNDLGYEIIQKFDGNNSLDKIERKLEEKGLGLDVFRFTKFLASRGFIENLTFGLPKIEQIDTVKYPLISPNSKWLLRVYHKFMFIFSKPFLAFYVPFCGIALSLFFLNLSTIAKDAPTIFHPGTSISCLIIALVLFFAIEFLHELSHAATYYNIGGTPQAIGFCYHFLIPFFYTDVPGLRLFPPRRRIKVLLAGPVSTVFFGSLFVILHFYDITLRNAWAVLSIACFFSALFTLTPFVKTDGYYLLESLLKFPNFHTHALKNTYNSIKYRLRFLSRLEYDKFRSRYSKLERRILDVYSIFLPFGMFGMIYVSVFMALQVAIPSILAMSSQIKAIPEAATLKTYVFLLISISLAILLLYGIFVSILRAIRKRGKRLDFAYANRAISESLWRYIHRPDASVKPLLIPQLLLRIRLP